jgi:Protein of unknown function (DUF1236)
MLSRIWTPPIAAVALFLGTVCAFAQTVGLEEAVDLNGMVAQKLALTAAQRSAIYNAVRQQKVRASAIAIPAAIGAPVPPTIALSSLPDQAGGDQPWAELLKYAMVEDDVVVVDPVAMRVVDVIHGSASP